MCTTTFRPRSFLVLLIFFNGLPEALAQSVQDPLEGLNMDQLIDSMWDLPYADPAAGLVFSDALMARARKEGSYEGMLNAEQGRGECYYMSFEMDSAFHYYSLALERSMAQGDQEEIANNHVSLASIFKERSDQEGADKHHGLALQIRKAIADSSGICDLLVRMGNVSLDVDDTEESTSMFLDAIKWCKASGDLNFVGHAYNGMSTVHKKQKNFTKALEMVDSAIVIYLNGNEIYPLAGSYNNRGVILKDLRRFDEAKASYAKGLLLMEQMDNDRGIMSFQLNMGILANLQGRHLEALERSGKALSIASKGSMDISRSDALNEMARAYLALGQLDAARDSVDRAIEFASLAGSLEKEHQAWDTKSKIHEALGQPGVALEAYRHYVALNDYSMFKLEKTNEIDRLQTAFETEKKEQAIAHLQAEADLDQARKKWLRIGIVAMGAAAVAIVIAVYQRRKKDRLVHQAQLQLQASRNQLLKEQLEHKKRELTEKALHLAQKNDLLRSLKEDLRELRMNGGGENITQLSNKIRFDQQIDQNWEQFTMAFTETNSSFFKNLTNMHPDITKNEMRLAALLSMNLNSKEICAILNISDEGIKKARYRLRKKLDLRTEEGLEQHLATI